MSKTERLSTLYDRLKADKIVIDKEDFAKKLSYNRSYVSELFNNRKPFTEPFVDKLNEIFNIDKNWFETGEGDMFLPNYPSPTPEQLARARPASELFKVYRTEEDVDQAIAQLAQYKMMLKQFQELKEKDAELEKRIEEIEKLIFKK